MTKELSIPPVMWRFALLSWLAATLSIGPALAGEANPQPAASRPAQLTVRDFFRPAAYMQVKLNPAGTRLGFLLYDEKNDSTGLNVLDLTMKKMSGLDGTKMLDIRDFRWAGDDHLVFNVSRYNVYAAGLRMMKWDAPSHVKLLNRRDWVKILGSPKDRPNHLLVWVRVDASNRGRPGSLLEINLKRRFEKPFDEDGASIVSVLSEPPGDHVLGWIRDRQGEIRYSFTQTKGEWQLYRRDGQQWTLVKFDPSRQTLLAVDSDPNTLLISQRTDAGHFDLVRYDTVENRLGPVLFTDEKYDLGDGDVAYWGDDDEIAGLIYARQAPVSVWLDEDAGAIQEVIDRALPANRINLILNSSRDGSRLLIRSSSDRHPGTLYLFEPKVGKIMTVGNLAPWLPEELLGEVKLMTYTARDGLKLDAYVTLPLGHDPAKPGPMIVLPHGGPWVRDMWGYDAESQFFASRGYIVLRPNYRGSSGYNAAISRDSRMEFRKMHEDVTDAVRTLTKAGIADPERLAICGSSFGGYLAVCGAAYEPGLYKCAITIAGVFDWSRALKEARSNDYDDQRYDWLRRELGDPKQQQEKFDAMSPLQAAAGIKIPVFIAHGDVDQVADAEQSHRLAKILKEAGVPCETMFPSGEGHGFYSLKNRVELYERIEAFLKERI